MLKKGAMLMMSWIAANAATILVSAAVAALVLFIIISVIRNGKKGKSPCSCGCGCESCPMGGECSPEKPSAEKKD